MFCIFYRFFLRFSLFGAAPNEQSINSTLTWEWLDQPLDHACEEVVNHLLPIIPTGGGVVAKCQVVGIGNSPPPAAGCVPLVLFSVCINDLV